MGLLSLLGLMEIEKDAFRTADEHFEIVNVGAFGRSMKVCPCGIKRTDVT